MRSGLISQMLGPVFGQIAQTMVDAFVNRAEALAASL
jgi:ribosome-associated toxin RatA of RatAB toxin-antitoxin module